MSTPKRKGVLLDFVQKKEILDYYKEHPKSAQQQIFDVFTTKWDLPINRRTVGDILSKKELRENDDVEPSPRKRMRTPQHSDMERALYLWFSNARANNIPVTDSILKEKAQRFGGDLGVADFSYSNGWLQSFKNRHSITCHKISGESVGIDPQLIRDGRQQAADVIKDYDLKMCLTSMKQASFTVCYRTDLFPQQRLQKA